jgi:hypothetical protein
VCVDAAWKLKSGASEGQSPPTGCALPLQGAEADALYDLATNPEEQADLDCKEKVPHVWYELKHRLLNWDECAADPGREDENCEVLTVVQPPSCSP